MKKILSFLICIAIATSFLFAAEADDEEIKILIPETFSPFENMPLSFSGMDVMPEKNVWDVLAEEQEFDDPELQPADTSSWDVTETIDEFYTGWCAKKELHNLTGIHFSCPVILATTGIVDTAMFSISLGIHRVDFFSDEIGMYVCLDLISPVAAAVADVKGNVAPAGQGLFLNGFVAPVIPFFRSSNQIFLASFAPGIHFMTWTLGKSSVTLFGIGCNVQGNAFFARHGYFLVGLDLAVDFLGFAKSEAGVSDARALVFTATPRISIGFNL